MSVLAGRFPYKLVTFDVNGTLLKVASIGTTYAGIAKKRGVIADPEQLHANFKSAYKAMDLKHPNFGVGSLGWRKWWTAVVKETFGNNDGCEMDAIADDLIQLYSTGKPWSLESGAKDLLNRLKPCAMLGVISNTDPRLHAILKDHNLTQYFTFVLTSFEAGTAKPASEIFNRASELYRTKSGSQFNGQEALHIGNSYELDFEAAKKAGWDSVLVCAKSPAPNDCLVFNNLHDLENHFGQKIRQ